MGRQKSAADLRAIFAITAQLAVLRHALFSVYWLLAYILLFYDNTTILFELFICFWPCIEFIIVM